MFTIETPARSSDALLRVMDATGKLVLARTYPAGSVEMNVDLQAYPAGIYLLRMEMPEGAVSKTLVKE
jgi:uncharacterized protein YjbK